MAAIFQIRRGSGSVSLVDGELYVNKGIDSLQYAVGDREVTLLKLDEPNTGSLKLYGDITASNLFVTGNIVLGGTITIGDNPADSVIFNADLSSSIIPDATSTYDLGSTSKVYRNIYASNISSSAFTGSLFGMGDPLSFSTSVDSRLDYLEGPFSTSVDSRVDLLETAMSGSKRLYVSPEGSDTNNGTQQSPFKTIKAAVESLYPIEPLNPTSSRRYTIFVGSGNYTEQNPIVIPPGVAIVGDTLRTVRLTASNPTKDFFHVHDSNYFYGLRFLDLKHPAFCFSYPSSTATSTVSGGSINTITVTHSMTGYTDGTNQDLGIIIEGPDNSGSIATATADVVGGVITQINVVSGGTNYSSTEKPHISIPAPVVQRPYITTSPYIQNCSSITGPFNTSGVKVMQALPYDEATFNIDEQGAGAGIRIDGNLVHPTSPLESFVADAFTQVNQGGPGHLVINKGYAQFVSCFTTFCTYGFKVANGGFANISNSVIDFGKYGLVSKTYFPQTYNTGSSLETKTSQVSGFIIDENGAGYTGSVASVMITGGTLGTPATAEATVNANGSIDEIVLLTSGSGYTFEPTVTIAAPTGPGGIQAYTVANKAKISGVSEILMSLESGSRGIDISSNMILDGVDYLVTGVAPVTGSANQRRVTTYPAPPSITTNDQIRFYQLSNISTGGLVMEYVGSGVTYNALPKFGGVPIRTREINEFAPGRVFYSTVDNIGNLKIGDFFAVNQLTGEVTIDANSFNLSGLNAIGPFRRNGVATGVVLQEVSNNTTLLNSQGLFGEDTVPTQYAVKEYIDVISQSFDSRVDSLEQTVIDYDGRLDSLEISSGAINSFTQSANGRLNNLESKSASVDISVTNLNSYTSSLNNAIQLTGSTVSFLGNIVVYGTQSIINSENLAVADNLIYLNNDSYVTNPDLGIVGNYNDGTYAHTGIFRDASDGVWRVFKGYTPEPSGNIDLSDASYRYADFYANALSASTLSGIGNITSYSTSVDSRLDSLETNSTSTDTSILKLNEFSASVTASLEKIYQTTSSLNSYTTSVSTSISNINEFSASQLGKDSTLGTLTASYDSRFTTLGTYTASVDGRFATLGTYTGSINGKFTTIEQLTSSILTWTGSVNGKLSNLEAKSESVDTSITNINTFTQSVNDRFTTLGTYTGSVETRLTQIGVVTGSLNSFTASAYVSFSLMTSSIDDHEDRITYIEGINGISGGNPLTPLNIFSASAKISIENINTTTASLNTSISNINTTTASLNISIGELNSYTSSLKTAITASGGNVTINGNLTVKGTTTQIDSTTLSIGDNIIELNYGASQTTAGIYVKDGTGTSTTSGSLIWDSANGSDYWKAGKLGNESKILLAGGDNVVSSSTQIVPLLPTGLVSGSSQINVESTTGDITLGTRTFGNYVASLVAGTGVTITNNSGETATPTIAIGQTVATSASPTFAGLTINGAITATGDITAFFTSDERLKENIQPITDALSKVESISGNEYNWKEGFEEIHTKKGNDVGVIAQEIQKILPQAVIERDNGYLGVNYEKIIPLLIQSIKELSAKVDRLENK
jgi:prefoldin subunit 5